MAKIIEKIKDFFLSDYEWKVKHCPTLNLLVNGTDDDKKTMMDKMIENLSKQKVCPDCHGIYWDNDCPECNGRGICGGYVINA